MFSHYKPVKMPEANNPVADPNERAAIKQLTDRLGFHMSRVIVAGLQPDGWTAAYSTMSSKDWPPVFPNPLAFVDMVRSLELMIEAFEPKSPNKAEDAEVRALAETLLEWDEMHDYVFVAYRQNGYEITVVSEGGALVNEWPAMPFAAAMAELRSAMPHSFDIDDTYLGTGRDYGGP